MADGSSETALLVALLVGLLIASGFFSGTETALFSLNRVERRRLSSERSIRSQLITRALHRPRQLLSTILFGNTLVNVATSATATVLFHRILSEHSLTLAIVVDTFLVLLIGEIVPKTIAVNAPRPLATLLIMPLHLFTRISAPVVGIFDRAAHGILRTLKVPEEAGGALSPSELELLFEEATRKATITPEESRLARNIMRFSETSADEIMTPRVEMVAAPLDMSRDGLAGLMTEARHSRIPIYEGSIDTIVGFVSTKEFFLNPEREIRELLKPVAIFPEGASIDRVFRHMQKNLLTMTIIVNEYGDTAGMVTVEDLVEEIVGEIYDEYESGQELIRPEGPNTWLVQGRVSVEDVNEACDLELPEDESITLNGYLCDQFGGIPKAGEILERDGSRFTVVESTRGRIVSCRIERRPDLKVVPRDT